jgi:anti-sigma factor RsiW
MNGHIAEEKIALFAGGELSASEARNIERHLSGCPACSACVDRYRQDRAALASLREAAVGESDYESVRHSVSRQLKAERAPRSGWWPLRWGLLAASVLAAAAMGLWQWSRVPESRRAARPEAAARAQTAAVQPPPGDAAAAAAPASKPAPAGGRAPNPRREPLAARALPATHVPRAEAAPPVAPVAPQDVQESHAVTQHAGRETRDVTLIKLQTSDPNVVIIWLAEPKGAEK